MVERYRSRVSYADVGVVQSRVGGVRPQVHSLGSVGDFGAEIFGQISDALFDRAREERTRAGEEEGYRRAQAMRWNEDAGTFDMEEMPEPSNVFNEALIDSQTRAAASRLDSRGNTELQRLAIQHANNPDAFTQASTSFIEGLIETLPPQLAVATQSALTGRMLDLQNGLFLNNLERSNDAAFAQHLQDANDAIGEINAADTQEELEFAQTRLMRTIGDMQAIVDTGVGGYDQAHIIGLQGQVGEAAEWAQVRFRINTMVDAGATREEVVSFLNEWETDWSAHATSAPTGVSRQTLFNRAREYANDRTAPARRSLTGEQGSDLDRLTESVQGHIRLTPGSVTENRRYLLEQYTRLNDAFGFGSELIPEIDAQYRQALNAAERLHTNLDRGLSVLFGNPSAESLGAFRALSTEDQREALTLAYAEMLDTPGDDVHGFNPETATVEQVNAAILNAGHFARFGFDVPDELERNLTTLITADPTDERMRGLFAAAVTQFHTLEREQNHFYTNIVAALPEQVRRVIESVRNPGALSEGQFARLSEMLNAESTLSRSVQERFEATDIDGIMGRVSPAELFRIAEELGLGGFQETILGVDASAIVSTGNSMFSDGFWRLIFDENAGHLSEEGEARLGSLLAAGGEESGGMAFSYDEILAIGGSVAYWLIGQEPTTMFSPAFRQAFATRLTQLAQSPEYVNNHFPPGSPEYERTLVSHTLQSMMNDDPWAPSLYAEGLPPDQLDQALVMGLPVGLRSWIQDGNGVGGGMMLNAPEEHYRGPEGELSHIHAGVVYDLLAYIELYQQERTAEGEPPSRSLPPGIPHFGQGDRAVHLNISSLMAEGRIRMRVNPPSQWDSRAIVHPDGSPGSEPLPTYTVLIVDEDGNARALEPLNWIGERAFGNRPITMTNYRPNLWEEVPENQEYLEWRRRGVEELQRLQDDPLRYAEDFLERFEVEIRRTIGQEVNDD